MLRASRKPDLQQGMHSNHRAPERTRLGGLELHRGHAGLLVHAGAGDQCCARQLPRPQHQVNGVQQQACRRVIAMGVRGRADAGN